MGGAFFRGYFGINMEAVELDGGAGFVRRAGDSPGFDQGAPQSLARIRKSPTAGNVIPLDIAQHQTSLSDQSKNYVCHRKT